MLLGLLRIYVPSIWKAKDQTGKFVSAAWAVPKQLKDTEQEDGMMRTEH